MGPNELNLRQLKRLMLGAGVTHLYLKRLAENDNSKNQVYLGPDFIALNVLPSGELIGDPRVPERLKAAVNFSWLSSTSGIEAAPHAQLILYPQYPEVRFSGFLRGCRSAPRDVMTMRQAGRILFFGITSAAHVLGFATTYDSSLANEVNALNLQPETGVFSQIPLEDGADERAVVLAELSRIAALEWIDSKRLNGKGEILDCNAPNCGGYTLEAELGIRPNGISDPDFHGWEIKQHAVTNLMRPASGGPITLMTPEPTGGFYVDAGIKEFIRRYGYPDRTDEDRRNFGGIHNSRRACAATNLVLTLQGYDLATQKITDFSGGISLVDLEGSTAAVWYYKDLLMHWTRKHAKAAYIPSIVRKEPRHQYQYGSHVRLAEGTEFRLFLNAVANGDVYYDPGIKIVNVSAARPEIKKRSQFRIRSASIPLLYTKVTEVDVTAY